MAKMPRAIPEKPQNRRKTLMRLWGYLYQYKWGVLAAVTLALISNVLALVGPKLSGDAIDAIGITAGGVNFQAVFGYCLLMAILYIISALLSYLLSVLMIRISQKTVYRMRSDVFNKLVELPVRYFDGHQVGDIVSRISYDIDTINASLSNDLLQIAASAITIVGSLVMMLLISPLLVLVFAVTIPISIFFTRYMTKKVRPLFRKRSETLGALNGYVEEVISGHKTTKAYHTEAVRIRRFDQRNNDGVEAFYNADYYGSMTGPSVNFINNFSLALVSVFGSLLFLFGRLTPGDLSSFVLYSRKFSGPINEIANIISELQSACAAAERVFRLIDEPAEPADLPDAAALKEIQGAVSISRVNFGYTPEKQIIRNLSLQVAPGGLVAIVGHTGAGKTTLINLLMRFYDTDSGVIAVDGTPVCRLTRKSLRRAYAMVLQDTWLFHGTIFENIAYGKENATQEEVEAAAQAAMIHSFISRLPDGYQTVLRENGLNISQGQKQLLTIARAMLLDTKMLILDEATSNVDTRTEIRIQKAMRTLMQGKTCFIIAHRLSTIQHADVILVMENGEIVEQGSHSQLMEKGGYYAELYHAQFQ